MTSGEAGEMAVPWEEGRFREIAGAEEDEVMFFRRAC